MVGGTWDWVDAQWLHWASQALPTMVPKTPPFAGPAGTTQGGGGNLVNYGSHRSGLGKKEKGWQRQPKRTFGDTLCFMVKTRARHNITETVLNNGWRLTVGGWWLVAVGDWWQLAVGGRRLAYCSRGLICAHLRTSRRLTDSRRLRRLAT